MGARRKRYHCTETHRDPEQSYCAILSSVSLCLVQLHLSHQAEQTHTNPVWPSLTVLDLFSSAEPSRDVGSAEFQLLANTFILITLSSLMEKQSRSRWIMFVISDLYLLIYAQLFVKEDRTLHWKMISRLISLLTKHSATYLWFGWHVSDTNFMKCESQNFWQFHTQLFSKKHDIWLSFFYGK